MQTELFNNDFCDIYVNEDKHGKTVFCYRTGMTVYEEAFDRQRLVCAGWNSSGTPLNVLEGYPTRLDHDAFTQPQVFDIEINGECIAYDWEFIGFEKKEETVGAKKHHVLHGILTLRNKLYPLEVKLHTVLSGSAVFTRYLEIVNRSDLPMKINKLSPMCGGLEAFSNWAEFVGGEKARDKVYSLGCMEESSWGTEGLFRFRDMQNGGTVIRGRFGHDRFRYPMFMLRNNPLGHLWFAQLAFSGGYKFSFDLQTEYSSGGLGDSNDRSFSRLSFSMDIDGNPPLLVLSPGETFLTPEVYIGFVAGDIDDAVNMMHSHTRKCVFIYDEPETNIATVGSGIGPERAMTEEAVFHTLDTARSVGAESLIIDAGWYCEEGEEGARWGDKVGNWYPDAKKHPDCFGSIRARCRENGLKFGLWMECERMGKGTPVAKAHPEWYQTRYINGSENTVIDMTNEEAAKWVKSEIERVINEYKIDLFRLDYNVNYSDSVCKIKREGTWENSYLRYYTAVYKMFSELRNKYPDIIFENCAGGGGRCDLGMIRNFTHTWVSDYQLPPRCIAITNGLSMVIPPERIDRLVSGMTGHIRGSLDFTVRATLFGKPTTNTFNPDKSRMNKNELEFVKRSFELYKTFIRPYMTDGKIFHHTPEIYEFQPKGRCIIERASNDKARSVIGIFNLILDSEADGYITVYPRGIDPGRKYKLSFDNSQSSSEIDGFTAINNGIKIRLPVSLTSELLTLEEITIR